MAGHGGLCQDVFTRQHCAGIGLVIGASHSSSLTLAVSQWPISFAGLTRNDCNILCKLYEIRTLAQAQLCLSVFI